MLAALFPFYLFLFLPIIVVLVNSFNAEGSLIGWGGFTTQWYEAVLQDAEVRSALKNSVMLALASTACSLVVGVSGALWLHRISAPMLRAVFNALTYSRILLPEVVLAIALLIFLRSSVVPLGFAAMLVGHTLFNSAIVTLVLRARLAGRDSAVDEAARDLGATRLRTFRRVTLPDILPGVVTAGLIAFTISFDNIVTSFFLSGERYTTIPMLLFSSIRYRLTPEVNVIAALMMMVTTALLVAFLLVSRKARILRA